MRFVLHSEELVLVAHNTNRMVASFNDKVVTMKISPSREKSLEAAFMCSGARHVWTLNGGCREICTSTIVPYL